MPDLFSPFTLKDVTLRNRIAMSPMTMYRSVDGRMDDYHLMYLGARAAGGFGLVFPEQVAIAPEGRTTVHCAGIYDDDQIEGHARVTAMIKDMGSVAGIQLGHTGRNGSEVKPWVAGDLGHQLPPDHPEGWQVVGPSDVPYGFGKRPHPVHPLTVEEIKAVHRQYAEAAVRALEAGYEWLEMHFAHGYLAASFYSPMANKRTDAYGGSLENRARFLIEALDAVREVWPEHLPLTMRLGSDDFHPDGVQFEDSITVIGWLKEHGLDLADISMGGNSDDMRDPFFGDVSAWVDRARQVKEQVDIPMATSWNLGVPQNADAAVRDGAVDVVLLGRPALANAHWPVWAARELGHKEPFDLVPEDWGWWLKNFRGHAPSIGWPEIPGEEAPPAGLPGAA
ncbi:NADH:flavin oxidoreductase/NADH oxidase [Pseudonocardia broussonetiae]|uniref:NADH:flavin oxidoreductase/NADH oxidase n=1 Tax=Pseudonocardia broussonetiae TaxID=2736640 RepID=A0A6M6JQ08_9PSEU|nr:NADH:flavin oxidoreductase/NADH oxidase [Pseudonocardia broussonetiae]QJY49067.1 NADH:flavin oxidoreductase/NADH oxidase [Pseudonocardia broussonetiae]